MNLETKIIIYKFTPQVFTLTPSVLFLLKRMFWDRIQWIVMYLPHQPDMLGLYFR